MVGDDRLGAVAAPAVVALGDVLQHAEQVHALPGAGGGDLVEVRERRDVADLVQGEQQRRVDRAAGLGAALIRAGDDVGDERGEQAAEASLVVGGRDDVERVGAAEQPVGADPGFAHRRAGDLRLLPGVERGRDRLQQA